MAENPFLTRSGVKGVPVPTPLFSGAGYSPALLKMAKEYAKSFQDQVSGFAGQKGMINSSAFGNAIERAYGTGFDKAFGQAAQQQNVYNQWAQNLMQMRTASGAGQRKPKWWETALSVGGSIAGIGNAFGLWGKGAAAAGNVVSAGKNSSSTGGGFWSKLIDYWGGRD